MRGKEGMEGNCAVVNFPLKKPRVCPFVTLMYAGHIGWVTSTIITELRVVLFAAPTSAIYSPRETSQKWGKIERVAVLTS